MTKKEILNNWDDDKLARVDSANFLTTYLNGLYAESSDDLYLDSFVMNINAGWGFGKTFFLKHWMVDLKAKQHPVVYFDAWENDYSENPLLAFMAELEDSLIEYRSKVPKGKILIDNVFKAARRVIAPTLSIVANAVTRKVLGDSLENIVDTITKTGEADKHNNAVAEQVGNLVNEYVKESLNDHRATKTAIAKFKENLLHLVDALNEEEGIQLPIYILVDELDRCRPTYAIELLEGIKHIFGVNGVFFIVATNKTELSHSIGAVYGNGFDSSGYLRRFFDQEYVLPKPNNENFANYLIDKFRLGTDSRFFTPIESRFHSNENEIAKTFALLADSTGISLRDQTQVARQLKAISLSLDSTKKIHVFYLIFLIMYKQRNEKDFDSFIEFDGILGQQNISFDSNLTFNGYKHSSNNIDTIQTKVTLLEILTIYKSYTKKNSLKLHDEKSRSGTIGLVFSKLREEAPSSYQANTFYPLSISSYPELVRQAGHLIN